MGAVVARVAVFVAYQGPTTGDSGETIQIFDIGLTAHEKRSFHRGVAVTNFPSQPISYVGEAADAAAMSLASPGKPDGCCHPPPTHVPTPGAFDT